MVRLLILMICLLGWPAYAQEAEADSETTEATEIPEEPFVPTEDIEDDTAVSYPVDI